MNHKIVALIAFSLLCIFIVVLFSCGKNDLIEEGPDVFKIESDSTTFAIIGDYGEAGTGALNVSELVKSWSPDFIITLGDNNYGSGALSTIKDNVSAYYGDFIYNPDAPLNLQCSGRASDEKLNRFFPTLGNHDNYNLDSIQPYLSYFTLPGEEVYYEFQWGPVHFFTINSGKDGKTDCCNSTQSLWLKEKLTASGSPFKIVYFHHPPYSASSHGSTINMQWPFEEWGASAILSGHEHSYQRITRKDNPNFPYVVNGLGGRNNFYACGAHPLDSTLFDNFCFTGDYGAIRATSTKERLTMKFYTVSDPENPVDTFVIYR